MVKKKENDSCLSYEDYLRSHPDKHSVSLDYFPFTDECCMDGGKCKRTKCKHNFYNKKNKACLSFELKRILWQVFGDHEDYSDNSFFMYFADKITWHVTLHIGYDYSRGNAPRFIVLQYSNLDDVEEVEDITKAAGFHRAWLPIATHRNLSLVRKYLVRLRGELDTILSLAEAEYTCGKCGKVEQHASKRYGKHRVCDECIPQIVDEYFRAFPLQNHGEPR